MPQVLRKYQVEGVEGLRVALRRVRAAICVAPTGSGKTTLSANMIESAVSKGKRIIFLAHRKELIDQCSKRLDDQGIDHGVIKAGNRRVHPNLPVQVASLMTIFNRVKPRKDGQESLAPFRPPCDLFIIDECHRATAKSYAKILEFYPNVKLLGLTATPCRTDGRGLGELFQEMVQVSSPAELTEMKFLVPARVFTTPLTPDFSKVKKKRGEFDQAEQEKLVDKPKLVGNIYAHWKRLAADRQTVIFAASRRHALNITNAFLAAGERCEYLDGETPELERAAILARLERRQTQIVVNVGILTEGWDNPDISCVVLARATESLSLYLQMAGRALRPFPGKRDCLILDHGGNTMRHGFVTDDREWDLEGKKTGQVDVTSITTCKTCFAVFSNKSACPDCGTPVTKKLEAGGAGDGIPKEEEGELHEIDVKKQRAQEVTYLQEQLQIQQDRGYKPEYARVMFFKRFGRWPGKEHGIKKRFERVSHGNGKEDWKFTGWEFRGKLVSGAGAGGGREVLAGAGAADGHHANLRGLTQPAAMEAEHGNGIRI